MTNGIIITIKVPDPSADPPLNPVELAKAKIVFEADPYGIAETLEGLPYTVTVENYDES